MPSITRSERRTSDLTGFQRSFLLVLVSMGSSIIYAPAYLKNVFYDPLMKAIGTDNAGLGKLLGAYALTATICYLPSGIVADKIRVRTLSWVGFGLTAVLTYVYALLPLDRGDKALEFYFSRTPTERERRHFWSYVVFAGWCWYVWALAKEAEGDDAGQEVFTYYRHVTDYVDALLSWYENGDEAVPRILAGGAG